MKTTAYTYYKQLQKARNMARRRREDLSNGLADPFRFTSHLKEQTDEASSLEVSPMVPEGMKKQMLEKVSKTVDGGEPKTDYQRRKASLEDLALFTEEMRSRVKRSEERSPVKSDDEIIESTTKYAKEFLSTKDQDRLAEFTSSRSRPLPKDVKDDKPFMRKVSAVAKRLGVKRQDLLDVMHFETRGTFDPAVKNPGSSATGLIQFLKGTAEDLGTTTEELSQMSRVEQMAYVEKYLGQFDVSGADKKDLYMAVLYPRAIKEDDDFVLFKKGTENYTKNRGLDGNKDGKVTKKEAAAKV